MCTFHMIDRDKVNAISPTAESHLSFCWFLEPQLRTQEVMEVRLIRGLL
jgi:hypothetical protein